MITIINANDGNGDQTTTIFQTMHFREPAISAKPKALALTHVLVYGYWCCQVTILSAYNASVASQVSGLFDESYLKKEYTCTIYIFYP